MRPLNRKYCCFTAERVKSKKKMAKRKTAKQESPYRKYIDEIDAVVQELYDFDAALKCPFLPTSYPDADGMARLREHAFLVLRLKRLDEDRAAKEIS